MAVLLVSVLNGFTSATVDAAERFSSLADWQGDLDPDTPITEVNTPGTHDSAMFGIGSGLFSGVGFAHNQDLTFAQQFNIGVRYIDGRFCYEDEGNANTIDNIFCCHGGYIPEMNGRDISLGDMLDEINKFLDAHPTEYIFLPFKCESEEDMNSSTLNALLASIFMEFAKTNDKRYMYVRQGDPVPTVEEAKGHIIATPNNNSGIFSDYCCIANTYSSGTDKKVVELSRVFDINNVRKLSKETKTFSSSGENKPESERVPRLIHTSCYQAPFRTPARTSADIHEWILGKVTGLDGYKPPVFYAGYYYGIVLFDYVKEDECRLIINLNKTEDSADSAEQVSEGSVPATATIIGDSENTIGIVVVSAVLIAFVAVIVILNGKKRKNRAKAEE